nr:venom peptide [Acharia stimulea]
MTRTWYLLLLVLVTLAWSGLTDGAAAVQIRNLDSNNDDSQVYNFINNIKTRAH